MSVKFCKPPTPAEPESIANLTKLTCPSTGQVFVCVEFIVNGVKFKVSDNGYFDAEDVVRAANLHTGTKAGDLSKAVRAFVAKARPAVLRTVSIMPGMPHRNEVEAFQKPGHHVIYPIAAQALYGTDYEVLGRKIASAACAVVSINRVIPLANPPSPVSRSWLQRLRRTVVAYHNTRRIPVTRESITGYLKHVFVGSMENVILPGVGESILEVVESLTHHILDCLTCSSGYELMVIDRLMASGDAPGASSSSTGYILPSEGSMKLLEEALRGEPGDAWKRGTLMNVGEDTSESLLLLPSGVIVNTDGAVLQDGAYSIPSLLSTLSPECAYSCDAYRVLVDRLAGRRCFDRTKSEKASPNASDLTAARTVLTTICEELVKAIIFSPEVFQHVRIYAEHGGKSPMEKAIADLEFAPFSPLSFEFPPLPPPPAPKPKAEKKPGGKAARAVPAAATGPVQAIAGAPLETRSSVAAPSDIEPDAPTEPITEVVSAPAKPVAEPVPDLVKAAAPAAKKVPPKVVPKKSAGGAGAASKAKQTSDMLK